jgi:uncharacterized phage-associated protein
VLARPENNEVAPGYGPHDRTIVGFRSRKAAQICTYFALQSEGLIEKLKLIKLVYLSERACLALNHRPMLFDELFSLPHGPICSSTLNGIDGEIHGHIWDDFVARNSNEIVALKKFTREVSMKSAMQKSIYWNGPGVNLVI